MAVKTAEAVARNVVKGLKINQSNNQIPSEIIVPVNLDGREIARVTAPLIDRAQGDSLVFASRGSGL